MKKTPEFNPRRLDARAFSRSGAKLSGQWPLSGFARLRDVLAATDDGVVQGTVDWDLRGEEVPQRGGATQAWLHLQARAVLPLVCQRCLAPTHETLTLERDYQFVADEETAQLLDAEVEHEVLVLDRELDLHALLEDELLLDLPLVPRHEVCPQPLEAGGNGSVAGEKPFAALAGMIGARRETE